MRARTVPGVWLCPCVVPPHPQPLMVNPGIGFPGNAELGCHMVRM